MLTWRKFIVQRPHAWDSLGETLRISGHALLEVKQHADMASDVSWWRGNLIMFYWCVRWHGDDEVGDPPAWHTVIQMMCLTDGPFWLTIMVWPVQSNWVIGSVDSRPRVRSVFMRLWHHPNVRDVTTLKCHLRKEIRNFLGTTLACAKVFEMIFGPIFFLVSSLRVAALGFWFEPWFDD